MRYVMGDVRDVREESERYDMCEMRDTKQWNYIEILKSITYLLSDITESRDAIASENLDTIEHLGIFEGQMDM